MIVGPLRASLLCSCVLVAGLSPALADAGSDDYETVVVSASRFEEQARLQQKNALNIVNVQPAEAILKFPDFNAAESLSRMPGISLMSDTGEGRFVMIRGIDGNLNGATYGGVVLLNTYPGGTYQGGGGRAVEFDTVPGGAIDGIVVTKSLTPDHDAEGLGGTVELTPRTAANITAPFADLSLGAGYEPIHGHGGPYSGDVAVGARFGFDNGLVVEHGQSAGKVNPGFISNPTPFSFVLDASYREDRRGFDDLEADYINSPANPTTASNKRFDDLQLRKYDYHRRRFGLGGEFDFKPNDEHRYYFRANMFGYIESATKNHLIFNVLGDDNPPTVTGNSIVTHSDITLKGTDEEETHRNNVYVLGGEDDFHLFKIDYRASYSRATYTMNRDYGTTFKGPTVAVTYDNIDSANFPTMLVTDGTNLNDPSLFKLSKFSNKKAADVDEEWAYAGNVAVPVDILSDKDEVKFGFSVRLRDKTAAELPQDISLPSSKPKLNTLSPFAADTTYYHNRYSNGPGINMPALEALSTITYGGFAVDNSTWFAADENIYAGYAMYTGESGPWGVLAGVRIEATNAKYAFYDLDSSGDNTAYTRVRHAYVDVFPTVQLRYAFSDELVARATYSSGIGRPGFNQVAQPTSISSDTNTRVIGNPNLKPVTGNDFDLDLEYYLNDGGIVEFGAFDKEFQNYNYTTKVLITGDPLLDPTMHEYLQSSGNLGDSYARGLEAAYQQKFTFLPKPFDSFGLEGNVSYVASSGALRSGEAGHALPGTSPVTMNASLFYEAFGLDLRLSSQYVAHSLYQVGGSRATDVFEDSRFTLDWTSSYDLCDNATVYFNVKNITNSPLRIFMGSPNWPIQREFYDQTFESGVRLKL